MFWKNKRPPYWNSISGFVFDHFTVIGMYCTSAYRISSKSDHPLWKYDVISIDQFLRWWPRRPNTTSLLPVSYLLMSLYSESQIYQQTKFHRYVSIHGWDITTSGLEKTNVRHFGILLLVSLLTISPQSACYCASVCRISSKLDHPLRKCNVISIFKMAAVSHVVFALEEWRTTHEVCFLVWTRSSNRRISKTILFLTFRLWP